MADVDSAEQMLGMSIASTDRDIPVEHMDYKYIEKCTNVKELEKMIKVLRSGKEGFYPDLIDFCEKRIAALDSSSKSLRKESKPATEYDLGKEEWKQVKIDVKDWMQDISKEEDILESASHQTEEENLPPVRNRGTISTAGKKNDESKKEWAKPSKDRIKGDDFHAWDKFDAEGAADKVDKDGEESVKETSEKLAKSRSVGMKDIIDTSGMSDRERELVANREKDKGNEAFRAGDYSEAIHYYSRSLSVVESAPAFNNRSLARIKTAQFEGAVEDCTKVLELEPSNIKALLRRGTARKSLKNYELARKDLEEVLRVEPKNKQAVDLVNDITNKMEKEKRKSKNELNKKKVSGEFGKEAEAEMNPKSKLLQNGNAKRKPGGRRLVIEEVEGDESDEGESVGVKEKSKKEVNTVDKNAKNKGMKSQQESKKSAEKVKQNPGGESKKSKDTSGDVTAGAQPHENEVKVQHSEREDDVHCNDIINGVSETDGAVGSKLKTAPVPAKSAKSSDSSLLGKHGHSSSSKSAVAAAEPEKAEEVAKAPEPPKPAPPIPDAVVFLINGGNEFFKTGQYENASERYSKAIGKLMKDKATYPSAMATLYANRASCHLKSGKSKSCIEDCNASLELNPNNVKTYVKRAQAYETMERYGHAFVDYKTAMNFDLYNKNAQNGASRMSNVLKDAHGSCWRDKLPSQPKSPSIPWPAYTMPITTQPSTTTTSSLAGPTPTAVTTQTSTPVPGPAPTPVTSIPNATPSPATPPSPTVKSTPPSTQEAGINTTDDMPTSSPLAAKEMRQPPPPAKNKRTNQTPKTPSKEERFQDFKAQGNDLVKKHEYSQAVGCYSRCIAVDASQSVSFTNRALCYLKLNLPEDAILDCDEALKLDSKNIKAFYRRALARKMLGNFSESARDLKELLKIDPTNAPANRELEVVKDAWRKDLRDQQTKKLASQASQPKAGAESEASKKTRKSGKRIQIQEVDDSSEEEVDKKSHPTKSTANLVPPSTSATKGKAETATCHPGAPAKHGDKSDQPTSIPAADKGAADKQSAECNKKGGKPKGGETKMASTSSASTTVPKKVSAYEFMQEWTALKKKKNLEAYAALIRRVQPNDLPKVLSNKLDGDMLSKFLNAASNHLITYDIDFTYQLLSKLRTVDRFKTMTMFLSKTDKDNMQRCINVIASKPEVCKEEDLKKLKKAYNL